MSIQVAFMGWRMTLDNMTTEEIRTACVELENSIAEKYKDKGEQFLADIYFVYNGENSDLADFINNLTDENLRFMMFSMIWFNYYGTEYDYLENV